MFFIGAKDLHLVFCEMPMQILRPEMRAHNDRRGRERAERIGTLFPRASISLILFLASADNEAGECGPRNREGKSIVARILPAVPGASSPAPRAGRMPTPLRASRPRYGSWHGHLPRRLGVLAMKLHRQEKV